MSKINKIKIDNVTYDIEDAALTETVQNLSMPYSATEDYGIGTLGKAVKDLESADGISESAFASSEESTTASKAYAVGDYFWLNSTLYRVTVAIASGGTITVGTNCVSTKLGNNLSDFINFASYDTSFTPTLTNGQYIAQASGIINSSSNYCRSSSFQGLPYGRYAVTLADSNYQMCIMFYAEEYSMTTGDGYLGYDGYRTGEHRIRPDAYRFAMSFKKTAGGTMTDSDVDAIASALTIRRVTDTNLERSGIAADALSTGNAIDNVLNVAENACGNSVSINLLKYASDDLTSLNSANAFSGYNKRKIVLHKNRIHQEPIYSSTSGSSTYYGYVISKGPRSLGSGNLATLTGRLTADDFVPLNMPAATQIGVKANIHSIKTASTSASITTSLVIIATYNTDTSEISTYTLGGADLYGDEKERYASYDRNLSYLFPAIMDNKNIAVIYQSRYPCMTEDIDIEFYMTYSVQSWERPIRTSVYNGSSATTNHNVNDLLMIRGALYKVIAPIANGDDFVVDTNIELTDVCRELAVTTNAEMLAALYS